MQKALEIAKAIKKNLEADHSSLLDDYNLLPIFRAIYNIPNVDIEDKNRIICYIIYAYDPESTWLDLKTDRLVSKNKILDSLGANMTLPIYERVIWVNDDIVGMCIFNYLEQLKTHKWKDVFDLLDLASKIRRFATEETEDERSYQRMNKEGEVKNITSEIELDTLVKIYKGKSDLMDQSIEKRRKADAIIDEIRKDFVLSDMATQSDFSFNFTESSKRKDVLSWRSFIRERNEKKSIL